MKTVSHYLLNSHYRKTQDTLQTENMQLIHFQMHFMIDCQRSSYIKLYGYTVLYTLSLLNHVLNQCTSEKLNS